MSAEVGPRQQEIAPPEYNAITKLNGLLSTFGHITAESRIKHLKKIRKL